MTIGKLTLALSVACGLASRAGAATPVPNTFTAGTPAKATEVNANFQAVVTQIGAVEAQVAAAVPPGTILPYVGASAPPGFLLCDGTEVSRTTYQALFAVVGIGFGGGDGIATFNLPDLRSRFLLGAGQGPGLSSRGLGQAGGEEAHALTTGELPAHSHGGATGNESADHAHGTDGSGAGGNPAASPFGASGLGALGNAGQFTGTGSYSAPRSSGAISTSGSGAAQHHAHAIPSEGAGTAHNTMPPFFAVNWIIKT